VLVWNLGELVETTTILQRLKWQNMGLRTGLWQVYNHGSGSSTEVWLLLGVDDASVEALRAQNLKSFYKMQWATFMAVQRHETRRWGTILLGT
jgi:hypothetical protein